MRIDLALSAWEAAVIVAGEAADLGVHPAPGLIALSRSNRGSPLFPALSGALVVRRSCPGLVPSTRRLRRTDRRGDTPWPLQGARRGWEDVTQRLVEIYFEKEFERRVPCVTLENSSES